MQYLRKAFFLHVKIVSSSVNASTNTPNCMKLLVNISCLWTLLDELLNYLQLPITASFKTTRIVKDKTRVILKYHLILDVMLSTLQGEDIITNQYHGRRMTYPQGWIKGRRLDLRLRAWMSVSGMNVWTSMIHSTFLPSRSKIIGFACSVADSSQNCCLACVGFPNCEDTELLKPCSIFLNLLSSEQGFRWSRHCEGYYRRC